MKLAMQGFLMILLATMIMIAWIGRCVPVGKLLKNASKMIMKPLLEAIPSLFADKPFVARQILDHGCLQVAHPSFRSPLRTDKCLNGGRVGRR